MSGGWGTQSWSNDADEKSWAADPRAEEAADPWSNYGKTDGSSSAAAWNSSGRSNSGWGAASSSGRRGGGAGGGGWKNGGGGDSWGSGGDAWGSNDWKSTSAGGEDQGAGQDTWAADPWSSTARDSGGGGDGCENLDKKIDWAAVGLKEFTKQFFVEHPAQRNRSQEEVEQQRKTYDIEILDDGGAGSVPKLAMNFEEACLPKFIMECIAKSKLRTPTPIQMQVIPAALDGRDLIGIAETGSGKTLAYMLPLLVHASSQPEVAAGEGPIGVVMAPTRELAQQIERVANDFVGTSGMKSYCLFGGGDVKEQKWAMEERNEIIVATPGRFIQCLNERWTNLNRVTYLVLDEADEMLDKGFRDQIDLIMSHVRPDRQLLMFSATWGDKVQELARIHCRENNPMRIRVGGDKLAACKNITQVAVMVQDDESRFTALQRALEKTECLKKGSLGKCLVFCSSKALVDEVHTKMVEMGIHALSIHGDKKQADRNWSLSQFRDGDCRVLVCTSVMGRGHDIPRVRYVINYNMPRKIEDYVHRIGRCGRAGEQGYSLTLLSEKDYSVAADLVAVLRATNQTVMPDLEQLAKGGAESKWWDASPERQTQDAVFTE